VEWSYKSGIKTPQDTGDKIPSNAETLKLPPRTDLYVLKVENVNFHNAGTYICRGKFKNKAFMAKGDLHVIGMFPRETNQF